MQHDLTDAVKWAIDSGIADPKRICIAGAPSMTFVLSNVFVSCVAMSLRSINQPLLLAGQSSSINQISVAVCCIVLSAYICRS
jgi:hypothetical protein